MPQAPGDPAVETQVVGPVESSVRVKWARWLPLLLPAVVSAIVSAGVVAGGGWYVLNQQDAALAAAAHEMAHLRAQIEQTRIPVEQNTSAIQMLASPAVRTISMSGTAARPQARGRAFFNPIEDKWQLYVTGMKAMSPGKSYELWLITADRKRVPAGTFEVSQDGQGTYSTDTPTAAEHVTEIAVTEEAEEGAFQPTGKYLMRGELR